jgi:chromosomal replication initiator protein
VQSELAVAVDEPTYRIWLEPLRPLELRESGLLVEAPAHACRWIRERFGKVLREKVQLVVGPDAVLELLAAGSARCASPAAVVGSRAQGRTAAGLAQPPSASGPLGNPKLTFDQFVIGDCNRLAHGAALAVAEMPGAAYNPLFLCGPPGVGKTHLLSSIASLLLSHSPGLEVRCTTGEAFTNEFLGALGAGSTESFKARFRDVDVLLLDDVQFLQRKARTEEEFFHTFNALHDAGRQMVITSDRPPRDLQALEDRLRERFIAGLVADLAPPELATRVAILRMRVHHDGIAIAEEAALDVIAERIDAHVRALEGALIRVVAFSSLTGRPITRELANEVLDSLYPSSGASSTRRRSVADVQAATCEYFGLSAEDLLSTSRTPRLAWPRQLAMYLARELSEESLPAIGRLFGGRDHTTVLHAWRRTCARIAVDREAREAVENVRRSLDPAHR